MIVKLMMNDMIKGENDGSKIAMDSSSVLSTPFTHTSPWKVWVRAEFSIFLFHQYIFYPRGKDTFISSTRDI